MDGFICIDKPSGPSSFAAIRDVRKLLNIKKAGHAGTLDPMASGLLVVALGNCTRLLEYLQLEPKVYEFSVTFGKSTDTLDAQGRVVASSDVVPQKEQLTDALKNFLGEIEQVPPQYSAIKIDGKRAYDLARKGVEVKMKPRRVTIFSLEMLGYDASCNRADFVASCSAGTYIRTLACDIVKAADARAQCFVSVLRRIKTGRFDVQDAATEQDIKNATQDIGKYIISASDAFDDDCKIFINSGQKSEIFYGRNIVLENENFKDTLIAFDETGKLSAVLKRVDGNTYHPQKTFAT